MKIKPFTFLLTILILSFTCLTSNSFGFSESDLQKLTSGGKCIKCDLSSANLTGANLTGANLIDADLTGANLSRANLTDANLTGAFLTETTNLIGANLSRTNLTGADLSQTDLTGLDLSGANLTGADLSWTSLTGIDLSGANLEGAYWGTEIRIENIRKYVLDLSRANLTETDLTGIDLKGAILIDADLTQADLSKVNLTDANLTGANLTDANLTGAYLEDAKLTGADLTGANLTGADLTETTILTDANLTGTIGILSKEERLAAEAKLLAEIKQMPLVFLKDAKDAYEKKDYKTAYKLFSPLAELGHDEAQLALGMIFENGQGVGAFDREASKWYRLAAEQGNAKAQFLLGLMYTSGQGDPLEGGGGIPEDYKEAVEWYRLAAEQGHVSAQSNLGFLYKYRDEVPKDLKEAVKWFRLAAEQGDVHAQLELGEMYQAGQGVPQDYKEAIKWYQLAAEQAVQGDLRAQRNLELLSKLIIEEKRLKDYYQYGLDAVQRGDFETAHKFWLPLAEQGIVEAQRSLGRLYAIGKGVPQDFKEAVKWMKLAAEQGDAVAQLTLGALYEAGKGVPQDFKEAVKWVKLAAEQGIADAMVALKELETRMAEEKLLAEARQKDFLNIISSHAEKYKNAKNEIKKSLYRKKRIKAFRSFFTDGLDFQYWVGKISSMDTDKDGDATIQIDIGGVSLNNNTRKIKLSDNLFDTIAEMEIGDKVVLSGTFNKHPESLTTGWYLHTANKLERGAIASPIFMVGYSDIKKATHGENK
jgi:uncharacterized protein